MLCAAQETGTGTERQARMQRLAAGHALVDRGRRGNLLPPWDRHRDETKELLVKGPAAQRFVSVGGEIRRCIKELGVAFALPSDWLLDDMIWRAR